jgi:hypothetical protein
MTLKKSSEDRLLQAALIVLSLAMSAGLGVFAYLGIFSRYSSDDYCLSAFFLSGDFIDIMTRRYFVSSSRYTNILFIGLVDNLFGWYNVAILPALMLILFVVGLYLLLKEIGQILALGWSRWLVFFMAVSVAYFSVLQIPALYETLYWRAGMTSHFAPLVFIPFFGVFLLRQIKLAEQHPPSLWIQAVCFLSPFLIGGFSEPPTALMVTILTLAIFVVWQWGRRESRRSILTILLWALIGALSALMVMALAPANSIRLQTPPPGLAELIFRIIQFPFDFIVDTFKSLPTPTLISVAVPALIFYVKFAYFSPELSKETRDRLGIILLVTPLLAYMLIAASFAPSAYGQSYPVARARFIGRLLLTSTLMLDGVLLGILVAQIRTQLFRSVYVRGFAMLALMFLALYPLRTAWLTSLQIPTYQQRAAAWDARDAQIRALEAQGVRDVVVRFLSEEQIQDLGDHTGFRLNRCAAALYAVDSIVAFPMGGE